MQVGTMMWSCVILLLFIALIILFQFITILFLVLLHQFHHKSAGLEGQAEPAPCTTQNLMLEVGMQVGTMMWSCVILLLLIALIFLFQFITILFLLLLHQFHHKSDGLEGKAEPAPCNTSELNVGCGCASQLNDVGVGDPPLLYCSGPALLCFYTTSSSSVWSHQCTTLYSLMWSRVILVFCTALVCLFFISSSLSPSSISSSTTISLSSSSGWLAMAKGKLPPLLIFSIISGKMAHIAESTLVFDPNLMAFSSSVLFTLSQTPCCMES